MQKEENYLALIDSRNIDREIDFFSEQGYVDIMDIRASTANNAIEKAKESMSLLKIEIDFLKDKNKALVKEITELKNNNQFDFNNIKPLEVLGFKEQPTKEELKKRYRALANIAHADKGGSDFIMKLINEAYEQLSKK